MMIDHMDHLVLTTVDEDACVSFYVGLLGMTLETFGKGRRAFRFGSQKINLHVKGREYEPKAHVPMPGSCCMRKALGSSMDPYRAPARRDRSDRSIYAIRTSTSSRSPSLLHESYMVQGLGMAVAVQDEENRCLSSGHREVPIARNSDRHGAEHLDYATRRRRR
jgi:catechol 2,3-dioxygenase-like lactoylglutathione lyase family enzyme